jgi:hypothetical protein
MDHCWISDFENGPKAESLIKISVWPALAISDFDMDSGPLVGSGQMWSITSKCQLLAPPNHGM